MRFYLNQGRGRALQYVHCFLHCLVHHRKIAGCLDDLRASAALDDAAAQFHTVGHDAFDLAGKLLLRFQHRVFCHSCSGSVGLPFAEIVVPTEVPTMRSRCLNCERNYRCYPGSILGTWRCSGRHVHRCGCGAEAVRRNPARARAAAEPGRRQGRRAQPSELGADEVLAPRDCLRSPRRLMSNNGKLPAPERAREPRAGPAGTGGVSYAPPAARTSVRPTKQFSIITVY
eukprot:SAG31_NODE_1701_length_7496_cov_248.949169_6_plen_229_part_00